MNEPKKIFMLCESIQDEKELADLSREKYKANLKYDGERVIAVKKGTDIVLFNRRGNIITYKFNEVVEELKKIDKDFMIDGEIISLDDNFNKLSRRALTKDLAKIKQLEAEIPVKYMLFDILKRGDRVITREPLNKRLSFLKELVGEGVFNHIEIAKYGEIDDILALAKKNNGEGIVIKDMNGEYESKRSKGWCKHKFFKEATIIITGYTENNAGIRATTNDDIVVQIAGFQSNEVKTEIEKKGYATINIQYLTQSKEGRYRFPSYRGLVNDREVLEK